MSRASQDQHRREALGTLVACGLFAWAWLVCMETWTDISRRPFAFAFSAAWLIMCICAVLTIKVFRKADPHRFYFFRWEREGRFYESLGIESYRKILLCSPFALLAPRMKLWEGRAGLVGLLREIRGAEGPHAVATVVTFACAIGLASSGYSLSAFWMVLVNFPLNIYPLMLQRWNRGRVLRLSRKLDPGRRGHPTPAA